MSGVQTDVYKADGVNVSLGDRISAFAGKLCRETYRNNLNIQVHDFSKGYFRGPRGYSVVDVPKGTVYDLASDGVGTKVTVTDAVVMHNQSNRDWVAMCVGDITRWGGMAALLVNDLSVRSLGEREESSTFEAACDLFRGLKKTADEQGYVMFKGETAELGACISSENPRARLAYVWSGTAFGFYNPKNIITGKTLAPGQVVIALREKGFRSNGISSVRKALALQFGADWYTNPSAYPYIRQAAEPSVLYDKFLAHVNGWSNPELTPLVKMHLIVHLTGGSFKGKFWEDILVRNNLSAELDALYSPPDIMQRCGEWRGMSSYDFYQTFNGGQGMLVVIDESDVPQFLRLAGDFGIMAQACGKILPGKEKPQLTIHSKFEAGRVFAFPD